MADAAAAANEKQARKAHELAEKCFLAGNVNGARQWMQSAVRLAPALPGTAQIVAAYDVHAAAARRRPPDSWYAVLGLQQQGAGFITHDDVKRQHRRLCLLVHPDKNPCAAADGAFKLVQAAWDALSARHPPGAAPPAAAKQPTTRPTPQQAPPPRAPEPQPRPRPRPTVVQMPRRAAPAPARAAPRAGAWSYAQRATRRKPPPPPPPPPPTTGRRSTTSPIGDGCPACGARTINGRMNLRCGSCQWSPMDNQPRNDDDDDFFEEDYY